MYFGIDLGTTNSLIGAGDDLLTGLVSSNVDTSVGKQVARDVVGESVASSYKTNMSIGIEGELSIKCSAIILKELAKLASRRYGEDVRDVVISVPAYFSTSQREAVIKAGEEACLNVQGLINEPTAAALFVCRELKDLIVVYDLGGGTFDVSIVDSRTGAYMVVATAGLVQGGDNLDMALVNDAIKECHIPIRFQSAINKKILKSKMRLAKEEMQRTGKDVYIKLDKLGVDCDYRLTLTKYKELLAEVFGDTIRMTNNLICGSVPDNEIPKIIFVGGSSACPYLRELVLDEVRLEIIKCDYDPDLIVAKGVAIYAQMLFKGEAAAQVEDVTKRLCIEEKTGQGITVVEPNTIIPFRSSTPFSNSIAGNNISLKLYQGNAIVAKQNEYIGTLVFEYGREVEEGEGVVDVTVEVNRDGVVVLSAYEVLFGQEGRQRVELRAR